MTTFTDAVERLEATDQTTWLGKLSWYGVTGTSIQHEKLEAELDAAGLKHYCPTAPKDYDVFRRVYYNGQRKSIDVGDGVKENLLVRQISREGGIIRKRIVIETVDARGEKLGFSNDAEGIDVTFKDGAVRVRQRSEHTAAYQLALRLKAQYRQERGTVNADSLRLIIRNVFDGCRATSVRPAGGVFFVPEGYVAQLDALERAARHLPGTTVHSLPLIDDEKQRANLRECYEAEVLGECDRMIAEITDITREGTEITEAKGDSYLTALKSHRAKLAEYQELLSDNIEDAALRLAVLEKKIVQVIRDNTKDS